ncbi:MAG: hypothetical protein U0166_18185 [Acidobacteriota bacterium]
MTARALERRGLSHFLAIVTVGWSAALAARAADGGGPSIPARGPTVDAFVPEGYAILAREEGDLDRDGRKDVVVAIASSDESAPRPLLVLLQSEAGYVLSVRADHAVPARESGGIHANDGFAGLEIRRGTIIIKHFGGATVTNTSSVQFRYQEGDWYRIGQMEAIQGPAASDNGSLGRALGELTLEPPELFVGHSVDTNYLTGAVIESWEVYNENTGADRTVTKKRRIRRAPLTRLADFSGD